MFSPEVKQAFVIGGGVIVGITGLKILNRIALYNRATAGAGNLAQGVLNPVYPVGGLPNVPGGAQPGAVGQNAPAVRAGESPDADYTQFATISQ